MQRTLDAALADHQGQRALIEGWVHQRRRLAAVTLLVVRDRSGLAQVVVSDKAPRRQVEALGEETVVRVEGTVTANAKAPGGVELTSPVITALSPAAATPPVELWRPKLDVSLPTLLDNAPIAWRHPAQQALWRLAAASMRGFRCVLDAGGSPRSRRPSSLPARRSPERTCSAWTTSGDRRTWPSPRSSTSR